MSKVYVIFRDVRVIWRKDSEMFACFNLYLKWQITVIDGKIELVAWVLRYFDQSFRKNAFLSRYVVV